MAFMIKINNPEFVSVVDSLRKVCSVLVLEVSENGLGLNMRDDSNVMLFSLFFDRGRFDEFDFTGDGIEKVSLEMEKTATILSKIAYPFMIESTMDGTIQINSETGRQRYKQNPVDGAERHEARSDEIREGLKNFITDASAVAVVKLLQQDFRGALLNVSIYKGCPVTLRLDGDMLFFNADSIVVEAEAFAPLIEGSDVEWSRTYNSSFLKGMLSVVSDNRPLSLHLFDDKRSMVVNANLDDEGNSYCRLNLAPVQTRKMRPDEEDILLEEEEEEDDI